MSRHFAEIAYTPAVRVLQRRYNGSEMPSGSGSPQPELGPRESTFIAARDSFYLATVSETGWPHVQHRGGPAGFLRVLAPRLLAFPDYGGNRQYVSAGNLQGNDRAALILMDYPHRRRLKILGHMTVWDAADAPPELAGVTAPAGGIGAERIMVLQVAAFDWNCSQHITPRYSAAELAALGIPDLSAPTP